MGQITGNQISCLFFLKRARLVESYEGSGLNGSCAALGLFIGSTWMAHFLFTMPLFWNGVWEEWQ